MGVPKLIKSKIILGEGKHQTTHQLVGIGFFNIELLWCMFGTSFVNLSSYFTLETNNLRLCQPPNPGILVLSVQIYEGSFLYPKKISFKFNSSAGHYFNGSFISTLSFHKKSGTTQPFVCSCRVSLGHENQRSEGPCAMRSTPHSHGNLAFCHGNLRVRPVGLVVWMDGWMDACVFSRSFFPPMVPYVYSKVRPQSNVGLERSWVETASAENDFPGCWGSTSCRLHIQ